MPVELTLVGATIILALAQILAASAVRTRQYGTAWNMGPRDAEMPRLDRLGGRLARAQANLLETLPLFIGAVLAAEAAGKLGELTRIGAHLYFLSRLVYVPLYAAGIPVLRSIVWGLGLVGLLLLLWALLT